MTTAKDNHTQDSYIPQELLEELRKVNNRLLIGIPCERFEGEKRLALTPEAVDILTSAGHRILFESGAGLGINYSDSHFSEAGAEIVESPQEVFQADIILKIAPPLVEEVALMKPRSFLFSMVQFNYFSKEAYELLSSKRITAFSYELLEDENGFCQVLNTLSEIEGSASVMIAAGLLSNQQGGKGILLGGIPGVSPTEIVIIGAGNAGTVAARAAMALGASVKIFDDDINKLRKIQHLLGSGLFTSTFHPNVLRNAFLSADIVIGAMRYINLTHRYVIAEDIIRTMKRGALIIDLRVSQGGCFETTCNLRPTDPTVYERHGILHYCKPNISNHVARTSAMALSNIFVPMVLSVGDAGGILSTIKYNKGIKHGVYLYNGRPVNEYVSNHFGYSSNNIDIYIAAF